MRQSNLVARRVRMENQGANRNKHIRCKICDKSIRSDHVKRHSRTHKDLYALDVNDMREEIKERKRQYENREERKRLVREIAQQEGASLECIEEQTLEAEMLKDN